MKPGLVGRKVGMTRVFADDGSAIPVTVLDVANNRVTQVKTPDTDGYAAVQVTFGKRRASRVTKPQRRPPRQGGRRSRRMLKEFPVAADEARESQGRAMSSASTCSRSASWSTSRARRSARASPA